MKASEKELAKSAFLIINEVMGTIHAGRVILVFAEKKPAIFQSKYTKYFFQIGEGAIYLALSKFIDLWDYQIKLLLQDCLPNRGEELLKELRNRKIREFRNLIVAHYADRKDAPKTSLGTLEILIKAQGFKTSTEMAIWTKGIIEDLEHVRNCLQNKYNIKDRNSH
jgi:hypothetical protein